MCTIYFVSIFYKPNQFFTHFAAATQHQNWRGGGTLPGTVSQPSELLWLGRSVMGWGILLLLAAGPTLAGYGMYNLSLSLLPSSVANLILTLEPAFTALIATLLLKEDLTLTQVGGGLVTMAGVAFLRLYEGRASGAR